jgi:hypothetical protein
MGKPNHRKSAPPVPPASPCTQGEATGAVDFDGEPGPTGDDAVASADPRRKLRLEWIEAGSLEGNPLNWRRHPESQVKALRDAIDDEEIGWAGACLYNERTGRLIDGHARKSAVSPTDVVPVLVGNWSENAEKQILATLDPLAGMARGDEEAYRSLIETTTTDSLHLRELMRLTAKENVGQLDGTDGDGDGAAAASGDSPVPEMELQPFEHYDYVVLLFRNDQDFSQVCERLGVDDVKVTYPAGLQKIGLGRVVDGAKALEKLRQS